MALRRKRTGNLYSRRRAWTADNTFCDILCWIVHLFRQRFLARMSRMSESVKFAELPLAGLLYMLFGTET